MTFILVSIFVLHLGCKEKKQEGGDGENKPVAEEAGDPTMPPEDMGRNMGEDYKKMMSELIALLEAKPPVAEVQPKVIALRDKYVDVFVAYGRQLTSVSTEYERKMLVTRATTMTDLDMMKKYLELKSYYANLDPEFGSLVDSFTLLMDYIDLDIVKDKYPEQAQRLGIE
jgi:hypothetical protein